MNEQLPPEEPQADVVDAIVSEASTDHTVGQASEPKSTFDVLEQDMRDPENLRFNHRRKSASAPTPKDEIYTD